MRSLLPLLFATIFFSLSYANIGRAEVVGIGKLHIELVTPPATKGAKEKKEFNSSWKKACSALGNAFKVKRNYYFHGITRSHTCSIAPAKKASAGSASKGDWNLKIQEEDGVWQLSMYYKDGTEPEAVIEIPGGAAVIKALGDRQVAKLTAMKIMDALPIARAVDQRSIKTGFAYRKRKKAPEPPEPLDEYTIFQLEYLPSAKMWMPKVVGRAVRKKKGLKKGNWKWDIKLDQPLVSGQSYWAQGSEGRGAHADEIDRDLNKELKKHGIEGGLLDDAQQALFDTFAAGYVGIRYGYPIAKGDAIISKSSMVGILAEVRGGPLEGLRWYWDFAPENKDTINGEEMSFTWSRPSLGWSFGMGLDWWLINRIDITPKIGVMDFDAKVPLETAAGTTLPAKFRLKNASNFGIELGIETLAPWFLVRFWGASDASGLLDLGGSGTVTSLRGGIDTYWDFYEISEKYKFSVLVFAFGERLTLTKKDPEDVAGTNVKVEGISYNLGFVGTGLILSW